MTLLLEKGFGFGDGLSPLLASLGFVILGHQHLSGAQSRKELRGQVLWQQITGAQVIQPLGIIWPYPEGKKRIGGRIEDPDHVWLAGKHLHERHPEGPIAREPASGIENQPRAALEW